MLGAGCSSRISTGEYLMRESSISNRVSRIAIDRLVPHPDNPNRMSRAGLARLVRNIERTGRYEPLVVRPSPESTGFFQIINGHHRWKALRELGYKTAEAVVWDVDDREADILLATLNRLGGTDMLEKKLALLKRLNQRMQTRELVKLLPQSAKQIQRLTRMPCDGFARITSVKSGNDKSGTSVFPIPLVFFLNDKQHKIVERALSLAHRGDLRTSPEKAAKKAAALTHMAQKFLKKT
jgi:ParB/RepB/Spo0J family partition protein